jgi:hypothetical protein
MSCSAPSLSSLVSLSWQSNGRGSLQRQQWSAAPASMRAPGLGLSSGKTRHLPELYSIVYIVLNTRAPESERACVCVCVLEGGGGGVSLRSKSAERCVDRGAWAVGVAGRSPRGESGVRRGVGLGGSSHEARREHTHFKTGLHHTLRHISQSAQHVVQAWRACGELRSRSIYPLTASRVCRVALCFLAGGAPV